MTTIVKAINVRASDYSKVHDIIESWAPFFFLSWFIFDKSENLDPFNV